MVMTEITATIIVDNIGNQEIKGEWGLCIYRLSKLQVGLKIEV